MASRFGEKHFTKIIQRYIQLIRQHQHSKHTYFLSSQQHFLSGYHYISQTGDTWLKRYLFKRFGSFSNFLKYRVIDTIISRLERRYYHQDNILAFGFNPEYVSRFLADLRAICFDHWKYIHTWTYSELFSFIQSTFRSFHQHHNYSIDLYQIEKKRHNEICSQLYHVIRTHQKSSPLPFSHLCYLVIRSNWIDCSYEHARSFLDQFSAEINDVLDLNLWVNDIINEPYFNYRSLLYDCEGASKVFLYECDNHGEIFFDFLFMEYLLKKGHRVICSVKSHPILNDVTYNDINILLSSNHLSHLKPYIKSKQLRIIDNGSGDVIALRYNLSRAYQTAYNESDIVLLKGQGNFESYPLILNSYFFKKQCMYKKPHYYLFGLKSRFTLGSMRFLKPKIQLESVICLSSI